MFNKMIGKMMKLYTTAHDASGEPSDKEVSDKYREVIHTHILAMRAANHAAEELEHIKSIPKDSYLTASNMRLTLLNQERVANNTLSEATGRFLMSELGWSKWDIRTTWAIK